MDIVLDVNGVEDAKEKKRLHWRIQLKLGEDRGMCVVTRR